ncbi:MAG: hypothetical protein H6581_30660 [Bacteroidia bacterium]|nr:hypothetical protein [Bacteroidia bacterium]
MSQKNKINDLDPEFGVDSRYNSAKERDSDAVALMEARLERIRNLSRDEIIRARLMQLKLKMEQYLRNPFYDGRNHFSEFLEAYIDTIYPKRSAFARDIDITPVALSQVINNHRDPKDEFMLKLMVHSEKVFQKVCNFQKRIWYEVYFHDKISHTMSRQEEWGPEIEQHVMVSEPFVEYQTRDPRENDSEIE